MKTCTKCSIEKPLSEYNSRQAKCKICQKEFNQQYYSNNPEKIKNNAKLWQQNNPEKYKQSTRKAIKNWAIKKQGIYEWYEGDICLYVGQSSWLNQRMCNHQSYFKNPSSSKLHQYLYESLNKHPNASIRVVEECSREVLLEREQHYIDAKKPLYNKYVTTT